MIHPAFLLGELLAKEKKLAKRCQKLGVEAPKGNHHQAVHPKNHQRTRRGEV
jgi:hypothetical protein